MYWVYQTHILFWHNQYVQARLVDPDPKQLVQIYGPAGYADPVQDEPYGSPLALTFQIHPKHPHPDNYFQSTGFTLFSMRLADLMMSFGVRAELFPARMVDRQGKVLHDLNYCVFHSLEGALDAMDKAKSEWTGDRDVGIPRLVLDESNFEHRPIFICNHVYVQLIRDDLKQEIQRRGFTGFGFLQPERYCSGSFGFPPAFE